MLALEIEKSDVKSFMGKLLRENLFDGFEARLIEITTNTRITIDGAIESEAAMWSAMRPLIYEIIKLCPKPRQIKIVFAQKNPYEIHTNAAALFLNLIYENDNVTFTTATAKKEFTMDKILDNAWDNHIREFFAKTGIDLEGR